MTIKKIILINALISLLYLPVQALAICEGPLVPCGREGTPPCNMCHIFELLNNILEFILTCLTPITAILMFTIGGIMFMLSHLEMLPMATFSQAKGVLTAVFIGLLISFVGWVLLNTFLTTMGIAEWTGLEEWWEIECVPSGSYNGPNFVFISFRK